MINKKGLEVIKGSEWEKVLFPEPLSLEDQKRLRDFRRRYKEIYPDSFEYGEDPDGGAA